MEKLKKAEKDYEQAAKNFEKFYELQENKKCNGRMAQLPKGRKRNMQYRMIFCLVLVFIVLLCLGNVENLMDHLLYAESKNCALLKEAAMDFMLENRAEVPEKVSFDDAPGGFARVVLAAMERGARNGGTDGDSRTDLRAMRINELRWKAHEKGLNVDGSREMLIAALKEVP